MSARDHDTGPSGVTVDELTDLIFPTVESILRRLEGDEFTTVDFIEVMRSDPQAEEMYQHTLHAWGEQERHSKMVLHGQVIPGALRRSSLVEWTGYAHDLEDPYGVPAWWQLTPR